MSTKAIEFIHDPSWNKHMISYHVFRNYVACCHRFNVYVNGLKKQYDKNVYLRNITELNYEIFLPTPHDNDWNYLLKAISENIHSQRIIQPITETSLIYKVTSVEKDHLSRVLNTIQKENENIIAWFSNKDIQKKRKFNDKIKMDNAKKIKFTNEVQYAYKTKLPKETDGKDKE